MSSCPPGTDSQHDSSLFSLLRLGAMEWAAGDIFKHAPQWQRGLFSVFAKCQRFQRPELPPTNDRPTIDCPQSTNPLSQSRRTGLRLWRQQRGKKIHMWPNDITFSIWPVTLWLDNTQLNIQCKILLLFTCKLLLKSRFVASISVLLLKWENWVFLPPLYVFHEMLVYSAQCKWEHLYTKLL